MNTRAGCHVMLNLMDVLPASVPPRIEKRTITKNYN
jgi:hypothetical protein